MGRLAVVQRAGQDARPSGAARGSYTPCRGSRGLEGRRAGDEHQRPELFLYAFHQRRQRRELEARRGIQAHHRRQQRRAGRQSGHVAARQRPRPGSLAGDRSSEGRESAAGLRCWNVPHRQCHRALGGKPVRPSRESAMHKLGAWSLLVGFAASSPAANVGYKVLDKQVIYNGKLGVSLPCIVQAPNNDILVQFNTGKDCWPGSSAYLIRSTDGGKTWGEPRKMIESRRRGGAIHTNVGITALKNGALILPF